MAGFEERLSKLEKMIYKLVCCDNNELVGPPGLQGPTGPQGEPGPPGADGLITFQNLNWMGAWESCVIYEQFDAISYSGNSYFLNCESSASFECETPDMNPTCWILLANAGATGPQGATGTSGNDGSNSGRWQFAGLISTGLPGPYAFNVNVNNLGTLTTININKATLGGDYFDWLSILKNLDYTLGSPAFLQITEVGNNSIIGLYEVINSGGFLGVGVNTTLNLTLSYIGGQAVPLTIGTDYTISWVLNGLANIPSKTVASVTASTLGTALPADFNIVTLSENKTDCVYLPDATRVGQEIYVFVKDTPEGENRSAYLCASGEGNPSLPDCFGYLTRQGIDNGADKFFLYPNATYRFTFLGNIAAGGKAFWNVEAVSNTYPTLNYSLKSLYDSSLSLNSYYITLETTTLTAANLTSLFPTLNGGEQVFAPNQPGGAKMFVKNAGQWLSFNLNIVP